MKIYLGVLTGLLVGTITTVWAAQQDFGHAGNVLLGLGIAVVKASIVTMFFMQLKYEQRWWAGLVFFPVVLVMIIVCANLPDTALNGPVSDSAGTVVTKEQNPYGLTTPAVVWCSDCKKALPPNVLNCPTHGGGHGGHGGATEHAPEHK
jgi:caa(3)-type oxidase subunit IV